MICPFKCGKAECNCNKIVEVLWWDTNESSDSGWVSLKQAKETKPCKIKSLGYLIEDKPDYVTIAADTDGNDIIDEKDDLLGRVQTFPRGCIIDIKYLS